MKNFFDILPFEVNQILHIMVWIFDVIYSFWLVHFVLPNKCWLKIRKNVNVLKMLNVNKILKLCVPSLCTKNLQRLHHIKTYGYANKHFYKWYWKTNLNSRNGNISFADAFWQMHDDFKIQYSGILKRRYFYLRSKKWLAESMWIWLDHVNQRSL